MAINRRLVEVEQQSWLAKDLAEALNNYGLVLRDLGRLPEAEACQRESVAIIRRLVEEEKRADLADILVRFQSDHDSVLQELGRPAEGLVKKLWKRFAAVFSSR